MKTKINEIFSSVQGEGSVVGYKQLFIRFCDCNLHCAYCDTEFESGIEYTPKELAKTIKEKYKLNTYHSISLTGGEPLLSVDFLKEFIPYVKDEVKIYLETNATLFDKITEIKNEINVIAADIKLKSATGFDCFPLHYKFFKNCHEIQTFAKIVFDENITKNEITSCIELAENFDIPLILQPKMDGEKITVSSDFCVDLLNRFTVKHKDTRLIPQVHKFINIQ